MGVKCPFSFGDHGVAVIKPFTCGIDGQLDLLDNYDLISSRKGSPYCGKIKGAGPNGMVKGQNLDLAFGLVLAFFAFMKYSWRFYNVFLQKN